MFFIIKKDMFNVREYCRKRSQAPRVKINLLINSEVSKQVQGPYNTVQYFSHNADRLSRQTVPEWAKAIPSTNRVESWSPSACGRNYLPHIPSFTNIHTHTYALQHTEMCVCEMKNKLSHKKSSTPIRPALGPMKGIGPTPGVPQVILDWSCVYGCGH